MIKIRQVQILIIPALILFISLLAGCKKSAEVTDDDALALEEFNKRAKNIRKRTVLQRTYDPNNLAVADSLYEESEEMNSDYGKAVACQIRTYVYVAASDKDKEFLEASDELLKLSKGKDDKAFKAMYYDALTSRVYYLINKNKFMTAQGVVQEALEVAGKSQDHLGLYYSNNLMGVIYTNRGNRSTAIPYLLKAEKYADNDSINICCVDRDIATNYSDMHDYANALKYAYKCKRYVKTDAYEVWAEYTLFNIYFEAGNYAQCLKIYNSSILSTDKVNGTLPDYMQQQVQAAVAVCNQQWDKAIALVKELKFDDLRDQLLLEIYKRKGDYKNAFQTKVRIDSCKEQIQSEIFVSDLMEMDTRMGNSHLKLQAEELELSRKHMVYLTVVVIIVAFLIVVTGSVIFIYRRRITRHRNRVLMEREVFYRNMTHQLRTPMTVVLGMVSQIKSHLANGNTVDMDMVVAAERQSNNLLQLIKQLVDMSKHGRLNEALASSQGDLITAFSTAQHVEQENSDAAIDKSAFSMFSVTGEHSILVAEDNDDVALLICNMLHDQGYRIIRACDGQEAWELLQDDMPDLLLTDIAMPRMDGLTLMRKVRADETMCNLPIVVVSARVEDHERLEGISAGAEVYLAKPFINEELILRVRKLLEQREQLRRNFTSGAAPSQSQVGETTAPSGKASHIVDSEAATRNIPVQDVEEPTEVVNREQQFIMEVNKLIDDNMESGDVSTQFLAESLYLSVSTLNRKLKNITGMTSTIYIRARRLSVAKYLLAKTDKSITEVEIRCGFNSPGYFARLFKSEEGMTPSEYRMSAKE